MRIAIISDIHSNLQALTRALELVDELGVDEIYCLGDIVGYGANPNECVELVRERVTTCVMGNHDLAVVDPAQAEFLDINGRAAAEWTSRVLAEDHRKFLAELPLMVCTDLATFVHSSPGEPSSWRRIDTLDAAAPEFQRFDTPLCFTGHTHVPFVCGEDLTTTEVKRGMKFLISVGSVGQPRDGDARLSFGLFDVGRWEYRNVRVEYDVERSAEVIRRAGLPAALADRLARGI